MKWPASLEYALLMSCLFVINVLLHSLLFEVDTVENDMLTLSKDFPIPPSNCVLALWLLTSAKSIRPKQGDGSVDGMKVQAFYSSKLRNTQVVQQIYSLPFKTPLFFSIIFLLLNPLSISAASLTALCKSLSLAATSCTALCNSVAICA